MSKQQKRSILEAAADVVVPDIQQSGPLTTTEMLASRSWFDRYRAQLISSGGRPTNPCWTMKRQIPFSPEIWDALRKLADQSRSSGTAVAPAQLASFLLEEALQSKVRVRVALGREPHALRQAARISCDDPRFATWRMPELFAGCVTER